MCLLVGFAARKQNKEEEETKISREWSLSAGLWGGAVAQGHPSSTVPLQSSTASPALKPPPSTFWPGPSRKKIPLDTDSALQD